MELIEKAKSKAQQRFFGMVRAAQKGEGSASPEVAKVAGEISKKDAKDFASTKHKGLPEKKKPKEEVNEEGSYKDFTKRARDASARVNKERQDRKDANAKSAYRDRVTKGVRFYDKKGKGHIRDGKKVYS